MGDTPQQVPPEQAPPEQTPPSPSPPPSGGSGGLDQNIAAALGYFFFPIAIIWLILEPYKNNKFMRFHSFQSLFLTVALFALSFVLVFVSIIFAFIPKVGYLVSMMLWPVYSLGSLGLWIFCMYKAFSNEEYEIPFIGSFARGQADK